MISSKNKMPKLITKINQSQFKVNQSLLTILPPLNQWSLSLLVAPLSTVRSVAWYGIASDVCAGSLRCRCFVAPLYSFDSRAILLCILAAVTCWWRGGIGWLPWVFTFWFLFYCSYYLSLSCDPSGLLANSRRFSRRAAVDGPKCDSILFLLTLTAYFINQLFPALLPSVPSIAARSTLSYT